MASRQDRASDDDEPPDRKPFLLRLPPDVMEELRIWAAQELRSLNGHIEFLLREALKRRGGESPSRTRKR
jgi:hypothetical protein